MRRHRRHDHTLARRRKDARRYARSSRNCSKTGVHTIVDLPFLGIVPKLLSALRAAGIVTEDLSLSSDARDNLECTYRGLCVRPMKAGPEEDTQPRVQRRIGAHPTRYILVTAALADPRSLIRCRHTCHSMGKPRGCAALLHGASQPRHFPQKSVPPSKSLAAVTGRRHCRRMFYCNAL
jgi:hypothetical protein